jgi:Fur family peroxide stress response transcriptional regulator
MTPNPRTPAKPTGLDCRLAVLGTDARLTPHRREVFQILAESTNHPTASDIYDRMKDKASGVSLATIYNCLEHLTAHGLIKLVQVERGQSRYCANLHEHVHFHCETCGQVVDAYPLAELDASKFWKLPAGTTVSKLDVAIRGVCPACAAQKARTLTPTSNP